MRPTILIIFCLLLCTAAFAQEQRFAGRVIDAETGFAVPYASVLVVNKGKGMGATGEGRFQFSVSPKDTLRISSIGYEPLVIPLNAEFIDFKKLNIFKLQPTSYDLDSVQVIQLTDDFYLKRPKLDTLDIGIRMPDHVTDWNDIQIKPLATGDGQVGLVISGFLNDFDKKIVEQRIINSFNKAEEFKKKRQAEREKYFNKELVKRVTRIDDRVIDEFMEFCNFLDGQILGKSEYEVTLLILKKYKEFLVR